MVTEARKRTLDSSLQLYICVCVICVRVFSCIPVRTAFSQRKTNPNTCPLATSGRSCWQRIDVYDASLVARTCQLCTTFIVKHQQDVGVSQDNGGLLLGPGSSILMVPVVVCVSLSHYNSFYQNFYVRQSAVLCPSALVCCWWWFGESSGPHLHSSCHFLSFKAFECSSIHQFAAVLYPSALFPVL